MIHVDQMLGDQFKLTPSVLPMQRIALKPSWVGHMLIACTLLTAYLLTMLPGTGYTGDTAKFQFVGKILGTPHETGYPTYIFLNHLFVSLIPFGSLAYKANLLSAIASIVACSFLFGILCRLQVNWWVACATSVTFGLTFTFWSQSVVAEVYSLNILFVSAVLYFFVAWHQGHSNRTFYTACALYACSFGNHLTMITFLPAILYLVWANRDRFTIDLRKALWVSLIILLGALQYLYIFWRTSSPETPYLEMSATDVQSLWHSLTGGTFRSRLFSLSILALLAERLPFFAGLLIREYSVLLIAVPIGVFMLKDRKLNAALLLCWLCNTMFALWYDIPDIYIYFLPGYFILALYMGLGLGGLLLRFRGGTAKAGRAALILLPIIFWLLNVRSVDQHTNTKAAQDVEMVLRTVQRHAIIVCPSYNYAQFFYYYLLGLGRETDSLYVLYDVAKILPYSSVRSYLAEGRPLALPLQRTEVPKGLAVYFYGKEYEVGSPSTFYIGRTDPVPFGSEIQKRAERWKRWMVDAGTILTQVGEDLYKVNAFKSQTFSLPSSKDAPAQRE